MTNMAKGLFHFIPLNSTLRLKAFTIEAVTLFGQRYSRDPLFRLKLFEQTVVLLTHKRFHSTKTNALL